ncbi:MAG TPA: GntR family transcriptional regulator [Lachnospiraceae bacterium]|nr:GntR family transcriptional regulator [Lachnospiraceae bacterium]
MREQQDPSLRGQVFQKIREGILKGQYKEHEELREAAIGEELGVSRTPVREALRQLELEGLVEIIPNKGAYVTGISDKDVQDIYAVRSMLEGLCARWATENITERQLARLEEVIILSEFYSQKLGTDREEQVVLLDGTFHEILYEASNSRILRHVLSDFHKYAQVARKNSLHKNDRVEKSIAEHKAILQAIRDHDADLAEQLANEHIFHAVKNMNIDAG